MAPELTMDQEAVIFRIAELRVELWHLEATVARAHASGGRPAGKDTVQLSAIRGTVRDFAQKLRDSGLRVCRVCFCTEFTPCGDDLNPCGWADTIGVPAELCTACIDDDLETRYLETVWAIGIDTRSAGPSVASAAHVGDVVVRWGKEERIVEADWSGETVQIVTATRHWTLEPDEPLTFRRGLDAWASLLVYPAAEEVRAAILVKAFQEGKLFDRNRAERLLGRDIETGELLRGAPSWT